MILFKKSSFSTFSNIFENNQLRILISLFAFYLCKHVRPNTIQLDKLMFYSYSFKTGVQFRFNPQILKVI